MDATPRRTGPFTPKWSFHVRSARPQSKAASDGAFALPYFVQMLDIETICANALRRARSESQKQDRWFEGIELDEWMYQFDVPITVKF